MARNDSRFQVSLPKDTAEEMEAFAKWAGISKSTLINLAIRQYISSEERWHAIWDDPDYIKRAE